jgi:hypothetical protein
MGRKLVALLCLTAAAAVGCGDDDGPGGSPDATTDAVLTDGAAGAVQGVVEGKVFHALTLEPLAGATVKIGTEAGEQEVTTDATGKFETNTPVSAQALVKAEATGQEATMKSVPVHEGEASYVELFAMPVGKHQVIDAAEGATIEGPYGATIKLPPGGLAQADGTPVTGNVDVTVTPMLPQDPKQLAARPGRARGQRGDGSRVRLRPWASMAVTLRQGGAQVNLAEGQSAELKMPVADAAAPKVLAMWSLDEATGDWVEEGSLSKVSTQTGAAYKGQVGHFSFWNGEAPMEGDACLRGCVTGGSGAARVTAVGVDELFREETTTGTDRCFAIDVPPAGRVRLQVAGRNGATGRALVTVSEAGGSADDPASCQDVGDVEVEESEHETCPRGTVLCGGRCVDTGSDVLHCGGCGNDCTVSVDGAVPDGIACVEGECGCPPSRPDPLGLRGALECVDTRTNPQYCGTLEDNVACAPDQECVDGACVELGECPPGTERCVDECFEEVCPIRCVDTDSDPLHCGGCGEEDAFTMFNCHELMGPGDGVVACVDGECGCPRGMDQCGLVGEYSECVDTSSDVWNCGECGNYHCVEMTNDGGSCNDGVCACPEGWTTDGEECQCPEGTDACPVGDGFFVCANVAWDDTHCGSCGETCSDGICWHGECVDFTALPECPFPQVACMGECVEYGTEQACSGCGDVCGPNQVCMDGAFCECNTEDPMISECGRNEECTDLSSNDRHCGACDRVCPTGQRCASGVCVF